MKDLEALEAFTHYLLNTNTKFVEPPSGLWNRVFSDWKGWSILNLSPCLDVTLKKVTPTLAPHLQPQWFVLWEGRLFHCGARLFVRKFFLRLLKSA